uniref:hypothetical protein n=1 Tax=Alicyclobacillus suci TaxID=2816080 RepID=UPI001A8DD97A
EDVVLDKLILAVRGAPFQLFTPVHEDTIVEIRVQMTRTWVREGKIEGAFMPKGARNRKEGWRVPRASVEAFIQSRRPERRQIDELQEEVQRLTLELMSTRRRAAQFSQNEARQLAIKERVYQTIHDITANGRAYSPEHVQLVLDIVTGDVSKLTDKQLYLLCDQLLALSPKLLDGDDITTHR